MMISASGKTQKVMQFNHTQKIFAVLTGEELLVFVRLLPRD